MDLRDAFFQTIYQQALIDPTLVVLTADHGAFALEQLKHELPEQYYNVGISEQSMISIAAGLALSGKKPIVYGINPFVSLRCLEQIQVDLCSMALPVCIVGVGAGFTYSSDGPTHHGLNDQTILNCLPNLTIYNVTDHIQTQAISQQLLQQEQPCYIRIEKGKLSSFYDQLAVDYQQGCHELVRGKKTLFITTGYMTQVAMALQRDQSFEDLEIGVLDVFRIKPLPEAAILQIINRYEQVFCLEEQYYQGGLSMQLQALLHRHQYKQVLHACTVPEQFYFKYGQRIDLLAEAQLDLASLRTNLSTLIKKPEVIDS